MLIALLPLAFFNSVWGWAVVLFIGLLLFGSRLPSVARNMGKGINEFKKGLNEGLDEKDRDRDDRRDGSEGGRERAGASRKSEIDDTSV